MKKFNTAEKREIFNSGVDYTKGYIGYCLKNYVDDLMETTVIGTCKFQKELVDFISGKKTYISNRNNVSFAEFCKNYETYRLKF